MSDRVIAELEKAFSREQFEPFIRQIRFPHYKNLEPGLSIKFDFPVTAIIGANGTNKTSILRALQACPDQYSISDYWFDTDLDFIDSSNGRQRYIHSYRVPSGRLAEVIKTRIQKAKKGEDYFETARPRVADGMAKMPMSAPEDSEYRNETRWKPIDKNVVYLDFRSLLSAYDILMAFDWRGRKDNSRAAKKAQVRKKSKYIAEALGQLYDSRTLWRKERIMAPAEKLLPDEIKCVETIIGRKYEEIRLVKHDFFDCAGWTVILKSSDLQYSEAYAGSGEFAAVMLVRAVMRAPERSLILLDEPETSLHPGAQLELVRFLCGQSLKMKHQIIFATHSQSMVEFLPDNGRKLLGFDPGKNNSHVIKVSDSTRLDAAFERLGASYDAKSIIVEDVLAAEIIKKALRLKGEDYFKSIKVQVVPGGANTILNRVIPAVANLDSKCIIYLDGDMKPDIVTACKEVSDTKLVKELENRHVNSSSLIRDGGQGDNSEQIISAAKLTLNWMDQHVRYLPGQFCPEILLFEMISEPFEGSSKEAKESWKERTRKDLGKFETEIISSQEIIATQVRALGKVDESSPGMKTLMASLDGVLADN